MKNVNALVSVVIPTLNRLNFIIETINSVIKQSYKNIEIIISDNGSNINVQSYLESIYNDHRIRYRHNSRTVEFPIHLNQCISFALGEYFIILSDDDKISENFIESFVHQFELNKNLEIGLSRSKLMDKEGFIYRDLGVYDWDSLNGYDFIRNWYLKLENVKFITLITTFFRLSTLKQVDGYPNFIGGSYSDYGLVLKILTKGDVFFSSKSIFYYRVFTESYGLSLSPYDLAKGSNQFNNFVKKLFLKSKILSKNEVSIIIKNVRFLTFECYDYRLLNIYKLSKFSLFINYIIFKIKIEELIFILKKYSYFKKYLNK